MNKSLKNIEKYSFEYDEIMNLELDIIEGANDSHSRDWLPNYSIKIPNSLTNMTLVSTMDSDHPSYDLKVEKILTKYDIMYDKSLADTPRHNNTLRIFYGNKEKATVALYYIKQFLNQEVA